MPPPQGGQAGPPQSTSVSCPSLAPSEHAAVPPSGAGASKEHAPFTGEKPESHWMSQAVPLQTARPWSGSGHGAHVFGAHPLAGPIAMHAPRQTVSPGAQSSVPAPPVSPEGSAGTPPSPDPPGEVATEPPEPETTPSLAPPPKGLKPASNDPAKFPSLTVAHAASADPSANAQSFVTVIE